eukprot:210010-Rhodomonas_salina.1
MGRPVLPVSQMLCWKQSALADLLKHQANQKNKIEKSPGTPITWEKDRKPLNFEADPDCPASIVPPLSLSILFCHTYYLSY